MSGLGMNLGDLLAGGFGAPVDRQKAFDEGSLRSAQTESAIAQARERRAVAQTKERENAKINSLADDLIAGGLDPNTAAQVAAGAGAGLGNLQQLAGGVGAFADQGRQRTIADPLADRPTQLAAMEANTNKPVERYYDSGTGMQASQLTPAAAPTVTPVGQAQIDNYHEKPAAGGAGGGAFTLNGVRYVPDPASPSGFRAAIDPNTVAADAATVAGGIGDAKTLVKLKADMPKAKAALRDTVNSFGEMRQLVAATENDPNLWQTAGLTQSIAKVPGTEGVRLRSLLSTLKYRMGFTTLQAMRQMSPTGGALGNVSNAEGEWLQQAIAPLNENMSVGDLRQSLKALDQYFANAQGRLQQGYDETFAGLDPMIAPPQAAVSGAPAAAPAAPPRVFNLPKVNQRGWTLHRDASGAQAYVSPDGKSFEEVQ